MRCLILLVVVALGPWLSVRGGAVEHWGSGPTEVTGKSQPGTLFDQTLDTSVNDTPELPELQGGQEEEDIETNEGYAADPNTMGAEDGDDGASDSVMEEDDLAQANPGFDLDQKKAKNKGQSAASADAEADDSESDDAKADDAEAEDGEGADGEVDDGESATQEEGALDAPEDEDNADNEGA